jgi:hypothetical protein
MCWGELTRLLELFFFSFSRLVSWFLNYVLYIA